MGLFDRKNNQTQGGLLGNIDSKGLLAFANAAYEQGQPSLTPRGSFNLAAPALAYKAASQGNATDRFYLSHGIDPKDPLKDKKLERVQGLSGTPMYQNWLTAKRNGYPHDFVQFQNDVDNKILSLNQPQKQGGQQSDNPIRDNIMIALEGETFMSVPTADGRVNVIRNGQPRTVYIKGSQVYNDEIVKFEQRRVNEIAKLRPVFKNSVRIKEIVTKNPNAVGAFSAITESVRGSDANTVNTLLTTIKAYTGFKTLAQMRAASPTGGALGQVSEKEIELLQGAWASLSNSLNATDFVKQLDLVIEQAEQSLTTLETEAARKNVSIEKDPVAKALQTELKKVISEYRGIGQTAVSESTQTGEFANVTEEKIRNMDADTFARYKASKNK